MSHSESIDSVSEGLARVLFTALFTGLPPDTSQPVSGQPTAFPMDVSIREHEQLDSPDNLSDRVVRDWPEQKMAVRPQGGNAHALWASTLPSLFSMDRSLKDSGQVNSLDDLWEWVQRLQTGQRLTLNAPVKDATRCWIWLSRKVADLHDLSLLTWLGVADESGNGRVHVMRN